MQSNDVIAAIATPPGRGGIGIVRISGQNLEEITRQLLGDLPKPRYASFKRFLDQNHQIIDQGIAIFYAAPHSYTGEDVLELHGHGGPAVVNLLLKRCIELGARLAEPGEFTLRAFLNNKIDLVQAESIADLIDASTVGAARCAMRSLQGEFSEAVQALVRALTDLRIQIEAILDFPEEEIDGLEMVRLKIELQQLDEKLKKVFAVSQRGHLLKEGAKIVLIGQPNVGKSSLLNRLAGDEVAIVTEIPGTTRDAIQQLIQIDGVPLHIIDTAGLRETEDLVEKRGIERTYAAINQADLALLLVDSQNEISETDQELLKKLPEKLPIIIIFNKIDLLNQPAKSEMKNGHSIIYLSAKTGVGIDLLSEKILTLIGWHSHLAGEGAYMARQRHLQAMNQAQNHLNSALTSIESGGMMEVLAEELRLAQFSLSTIVGEFSADDLLGEIFSHFCIGK